ncbi:MAG: HNH endonuclease [Ruminococcus sp.]|nr:HNH endonuclease [Ruminococcus sp.]
MLLHISDFVPEIKDRYFINEKGELFTDNGTKQMKDGIKNGYVKNCLSLKDNTSKSFFRHRLVMMCFEPREDAQLYQVNHKDGNKLNNSVENLEWCTNQENRIHACQIGLAARLIGESNPASKLKEEQVLDIIQDLLHNVPYSVIMKKYQCSKSTISAIKNKRNWKYLTGDIDFNKTFNDYPDRE